MTSTLHEDLCTCMIISRWILKMRNVSGKSCWENQNTHFMLCNFFFRKLCRLCDNVEKYGRTGQATDGNIIRHTRSTCRVKATDTHSEYLIVIAFPRQQWFRECSSMLHYTFTASLVLRSIWLPLRTTLSDFAYLAERNCLIQPVTKWRKICIQ